MVRVRFAPSPTGSLHLGSALTAVANRRFADDAKALLQKRFAESGGRRIDEKRLDEAAEVFAKMTAESEPTKQARGYRSRALLEMYRGRYKAAIESLHQAILINETNGYQVSEFRDRMYLSSALRAAGQRRQLDAELTAFIVHAAALHTSEIKDVAAKLMTSDVVWVVPTPEVP